MKDNIGFPQRILIVEVNWIGDVLFSTPFIRSIRNLYPKSFIACMIAPRTKEILELNPCVDKLIIFDEKNLHKSAFGKLRFILELKKLKFDTAFFLHRSFTRRLLVFFAGIRERIGYLGSKGAALLTKVVELPIEPLHKADYFLNIASSVGADTKNLSCEFFISDGDRAFIKDLLNENGLKDSDILVVINPGGNWEPKRWPKENFARLSDGIIENFNAKIIITGAQKDIELSNEIKNLMKYNPIILTGKTSLCQLGALIERADLVVANDSGPMHIAVSMKAKTIALFGPTKSGFTGPYGEGRYIVIREDIGCEVPCYNFTCKKFRCMEAIKVEAVLKKIEESGFLQKR